MDLYELENIDHKYEDGDDCPECDGHLVLKYERKFEKTFDEQFDSEFLGCSNYPKCNFTVNL